MDEEAGEVGKGMGVTVSAARRPGGGGHGESSDRCCTNPHRCLSPTGTGAPTSVIVRPAQPCHRRIDANHLAGVCLIPVCDSHIGSVLRSLRKTTKTLSIKKCSPVEEYIQRI